MPDDKKLNTQEAAESNVQKEEPTLVTTEVEEDFVDSLMEKYDTESKFATIEGFTKKAVTVISVLMAIFQLYIAGFSFLNVNKQRAIHLAFILLLVFLIYPTFKKTPFKSGKTKFQTFDWIMAVLGAAGALYIVYNYDALTLRNGVMITTDYVFGIITIIAVLYATWRAQGWVLPLLCGLFVVYAFVGRYIPGLLQHRGFSLGRVVQQLYLGNEGIMGIPLGTSCTFIYLFIFFGVVLGETGLSRYLCDLALAMCGDKPGGPAKMSILSSGFMGMISGNAVANVVTTGAFTIPLMKKSGYENHFAGAVEAVASTGGQIMPPVMGSAAFIMAEMLGMSYKDIMIMAILPAVLYYVALWFAVDFEAKKKGLKGISKENLPAAWELTKQNWHLLIPVIMLVVFIFAGFSTNFCAFWSILALFVISSLRKSSRLNLKKLIVICQKAAKQSVAAGICTAVVGIMIGVVNMTGLGLKLSTIILTIANNNLLATMLPANMEAAGMQLNTTTMDFTTLYSSISHSSDKIYNMYNLGTGIPVQNNLWYFYSKDPVWMQAGYNANWIADDELDAAAWAMKSIPYDDNETWLNSWREFIKVWNEKLPDIPLYSDEYFDFYNPKVQNWEASDAIWPWSRAVLDASIG